MAVREMRAVELAPMARALKAELQRDADYFTDLEVMDAALTALPVAVMIVNDYRQIVYANQAAADLVDAEDRSALIGARPGEALGCHYALEGQGGCGTSPFCHYCGAARAIVESRIEEVMEEDLRVVRDSTESPAALDLRITSRSFAIEGRIFTMLTIIDISNEKRRHALERIFFHDILNTVQKLRIAVDLIEEVDDDETELLRQVIWKSVRRLTQEIQAQRDLTDMESSELMVKPAEVETIELMRDLVESYLDLSLVQDSVLQISPDSVSVNFSVDPVKVRRVLDNMIKNALEADNDGSVITIGCRLVNRGDAATRLDGDMVEFWVHNRAVMPEAVQRQIFQRSFTTKGRGRGLGTYSMKLLTERYLRGRITFISEPGKGTTFRAHLPMRPDYASTSASD
jgi:signal transduction histidine kinase